MLRLAETALWRLKEPRRLRQVRIWQASSLEMLREDSGLAQRRAPFGGRPASASHATKFAIPRLAPQGVIPRHNQALNRAKKQPECAGWRRVGHALGSNWITPIPLETSLKPRQEGATVCRGVPRRNNLSTDLSDPVNRPREPRTSSGSVRVARA